VNIAPGDAYNDNFREVSKLERLIGEEPLARAYFSGDVPALDRAAAAIFGPCSLQKWAFALQGNRGPAHEADDVLAGRHVDYCATGFEPLGAAASEPPPSGGGESAHRAGGGRGGER
jgi:hypothetical protein